MEVNIMKKTNLKKFAAAAMALAMTLSLTACGKEEEQPSGTDCPGAPTYDAVYKVGICNYVDDASLNQIVDNIEERLEKLGAANNVKFDIFYDNCNADSTVLTQIIADFVVDDVDLMVGVATPVAVQMQADTADSGIPVVFSAVSDPVSAGLVESLEAPGANLTGTSDYLDTASIMNLIFAAQPDADKIGLLYDQGQDSSATPIAAAKAYLDSKGIEYVERTGTTVDEVMLAADALVADGVDAVFTPTDNAVMAAEASVAEMLNNAGIPHYTGADSFVQSGAFVTCGVNYTELGTKTADMAFEILMGGTIGEFHVMEGGIITVNTDTAKATGIDYSVFATMANTVKEVVTGE